MYVSISVHPGPKIIGPMIMKRNAARSDNPLVG
jgi:hypothetical protein